MKRTPLLRLSILVICGALLTLTGCDSTGSNGSQNQPPTADVSVSASTVDVGTQIILDGSGSSDADGDDLSYSWSLATPDRSSTSLSDPNVEQPTFTPDVAGDYIATLEVSNGDATKTTSATVTAQSETVQLQGTISSDSTLTAAQNYLVTGGVTISDGATLTIEPGTHLPFESGAGLYIDPNSVLDADGTASKPITMTATEGNEQSGWWQGVFSFSAEPNNLLNYVEVRHAGSGSPNSVDNGGVVIAGGSAFSITNSTIAQSGADGLLLNEADATLDDFSSNTFSGNADAPVNIPFTTIGMIDSGSTFPDGKTVRVWGTTLTDSDVTVNALSGDTPYRLVNGNSSIGDPTGGSSSVTVEAGVQMRFASGVGLYVNGGSVLTADGTSQDPITMTATAGNEQTGWWQGVYVFSGNANNLLNHVEIQHAGGGSPNTIGDAGVGVGGGAALSITNSTIAQSGAFGLLLGEDTATLDDFASNTFSDNADAPVYIPFTNIGAIDGSSTFPDGKTVRVWGTALTNSDVTVNALDGDTPYRFTDGNSSIGGASSGPSTLTVEAGVKMTFASGIRLQVNGGSVLSANGTSQAPITMTATAGNKERGWWEGVYVFSKNTNSRLEHVEIRHGGGGSPNTIQEAANIGLYQNAVLEVTQSIITDSGNHGVYCDDPSANFTGSDNTYQDILGQNTKGCS